MKIELSIVIATLNRHDSLRRTLVALREKLFPGCEVIVVDQSADAQDKSARLRADFSDFTFLVIPRPGLTIARNQGVLKSKGDVILFLDDDAVPVDRCLQEHLRMIQEGKTDAVAGRVIQKGSVQWPSAPTVTAVDKQTGVATGNFDLENECPVLYACGCNMSVSRAALLRTGLFEERFRGNALFEDVEFFYRLRRAGFRVCYNPDATVEHFHEPSGGCRNDNTTRYLIDRIYNHSLFYFRHIQPFPSRHFLMYIRNIAEFASRKPGGTHAFSTVIAGIYAILLAWFAALQQAKAPRPRV